MINERKWETLGFLSKSVRRDLVKMKRLTDELKVGGGRVGRLTRCISQLDKYRSEVEEEMFNLGLKRFDVFYGDSDE